MPPSGPGEKEYQVTEKTERKGLGGFDKVLIGCGIGCAAVILLAAMAATFATLWVFTPGEQVATDAIADEASLGVIRLHELADDPGTQELITRVLERIEAAGRQQRREQLPESLRWISDLQGQQVNPAGLNMLFPKEMTIAYEEAADGATFHYVVAVNPRTMVRVFKTMFDLISRSDDSPNLRADYQGHPAYQLEGDAHLAFVRSTVLFSDSRQALERAIDRLAASPVRRAAGAFDFARSIPQGDWDVEGTIDNETGLVSGGLEAFVKAGGDQEQTGDVAGSLPGPRLPPGDDLRLGFGIDVVSADEITGRFLLECGDRRLAERWLAVLEERYQAMIAESAASGLELEIDTRAVGGRVVTELRLRGIEQMVADAFTEVAAVEEAGGEQPRSE